MTPKAPARTFSWYVVIILAAAYSVNFLDRQVINILGQSIKTEMGISDAQLGLLTGTAFGLFYSLLGIPIARIADRMHRVNLITAALVVWSGLTALCGVTHNFSQLFLVRLGVGVGEAGGTPPSQSLISDYVEPRRRTDAFSLFNLGLPVGSLMGFLLGGFVSQRFGWRVAFLAAGVPGLFIAVLLKLTVREPIRGSADADADAARAGSEQPSASMFELLRMKSYVRMVFGSSFAIFTIYVTSAWLPALFIRLHGFSPQRIGEWFALDVGLGGSIGIMGGGTLASLLRRKRPFADLKMISICTALASPVLLVAVWSDDIPVALSATFFLYMFAYAWMGTNSSRVQELVPLRDRALAVGIMLFASNIIGLACGPPLIGLLSDLLKPSVGIDALRWALSIGSLSGLVAASCFWSAISSIARDEASH